MEHLRGKLALVTGATRGLGNAIARELWEHGASLLLIGRSAGINAASAAIPREIPRADQVVLNWQCDVSDESVWPHVIDGAAQVLSGMPITIAVCNAGIYGPIGRTESVPWNEWKEAINTNLLGTVMTCRAVIPQMLDHGYGKIIIISGGGATRAMPRFSAYAASKAAVVRFAETLALELAGTGIDVNSVSPGSLNTRMQAEVLKAGPERAGEAAYAEAVKQTQEGVDPVHSPAPKLVAYLASPRCDGISGRLISATWDNWIDLPLEHFDANPDRYTLRRIS